MKLSPDHVALLSALNEHDVKYVVVGGYAVGFHSEPRATKDLDVFVQADPDNSVRTFKALAAFGAPLAGLSPADFNDGTSFFQMGRPPERIDVLQSLSGVSFEQSWASREYVVINGNVRVPVISAENLILNKLAAARPRDLLDVDDIREAQSVSQSAVPQTLFTLAGWNVGFNKIACTKICRSYLQVGLVDGRSLTDAILHGETVTVSVRTDWAEEFASALLAAGVRIINKV